MGALDQLFALEVEFHRRLRVQAPGRAEAGSIHISYALQSGYEQLLYQIERPSLREIDRLMTQSALRGDPRDVLAAGDSVKQLLGLSGLEE